MTVFRYFSYGSNMLVERLLARCPSAKLLGVAKARGYELKFSKKSKDGSGKAMPFATKQAGAVIHGVLFDISKDELKALDRAKRCGYGYDRTPDFSVYLIDEAAPVEVTTYVANAGYIYPGLQPFDWYLALVIAGAQQHDFPTKYIKSLRAVPHFPDKDLKRTADALGIIQKAGFSCFDKLLLRQNP